MDGAELDVAKTPAFAVLDELFKSGKVTETKCVPAPVSRRIRRSEPVAVDACRLQDYKSKYLDLHEAVLKTYQNEKELLGRGRQLKQVRPPLARGSARSPHTAAQELLEEKQKLEASSGTAGELESAETLEEELKKVSPPAPRKVATVPDDLSPQVNDQVTMAEEKETMLNLQIAEYERNKEDLARDIDEAKRQKAAEFEPYAKELQRDVDDITGTIEQQKASIQNMDTEKKDCIARIQELQELAKGAYRDFFLTDRAPYLDFLLRRPGGAEAGVHRRAAKGAG